MCINCENNGIGRRDLMKFGAAAAIAIGAGAVSPVARAGSMRLMGAGSEAHAAEATTGALSPADALAALKSGNERFVSHPELCSVDLAQSRSEVAGGQAPWATIISCADSRVPPELIFGGHGVGELFVSRDAGNLVDTATLGTVEFGAAVLGSPLIVVLAHTACGAVKAACDVVTKNATFPGANRPDDRADHPRRACGAQRPRRFHQQRRQGKREADRGPADRGEHAHRRPCKHGQGEDRGGDL
jgi:carbonic anhydrase